MNDARNAEIVMRRLRGESLEAIAADHGITRERLRQLCKRAGIVDAVNEMKAERSKAKLRAKYESKNTLAERHGLSKDRWRELVDRGITRRWIELRRNCAARGIPFALTLSEYGAIVGKFTIGRRKGQYVLSIRDRARGYVVGNVVLRLCGANARATRSRDTDIPRTAVAPGVYLLYPGSGTPYEARASRRHIGRYATAQEAIEARAKFLEAA